MNWLQKLSASISTKDFPRILAQAIQFEVGGEWEAGQVTPWTEDLEKILDDNHLSEEKGYSSSFWISCKTGDGYFHKKWGVSVNFTVLSGSSDTTFDSVTGDWDFLITVSVQRAADSSWTPASPYPLLIETVGTRPDMHTIQETAIFIKNAIWNSQNDTDDDEFDEEDEPTPNPEVGVPVINSELGSS